MLFKLEDNTELVLVIGIFVDLVLSFAAMTIHPIVGFIGLIATLITVNIAG